jgi:beta-glucanase (GH16 family)
MSDLRRPLVIIVALAALCTLVGVFVFPGPPDPRALQPRGLSSIENLGSVTSQTAQPVALPAPAPNAPPVHPTNQPGPQGQARPADTAPPPTTTTTTTTTAPPVITKSAAPPAAASPTCGGGAPDVAVDWNNQPWHCTFDDEFNGTALDPSKWVVQETSNSGYHSGDECYVNSPNNVSVSGGTLNLTARSESSTFLCGGSITSFLTQYTSGMVTTYERFSQTYGLFEVRAKFPAATVPGLQSTLWLWPVNSKLYGPVWPASGEIDFAEWFSRYSNLDIPNIHYVKSPGAPGADTAHCPMDPTQFHTYGVEWTSTSLTILMDGTACLVDNWQPALPLSKPAPFNQPFMISLTQALGMESNSFNPGSTPLPATLKIDWVRVWS